MSKKKKILLVEDSPTVSRIIVYALEAIGYNVVASENGNNAIEIIPKVKPDLIILDIVLPGVLDGYGVCRYIKTNKKFKKIPVIMFTSKGKVGEVDEAYKVGANDYMVKPSEQSDFDRLIEKVEKWIL